MRTKHKGTQGKELCSREYTPTGQKQRLMDVLSLDNVTENGVIKKKNLKMEGMKWKRR